MSKGVRGGARGRERRETGRGRGEGRGRGPKPDSPAVLPQLLTSPTHSSVWPVCPAVKWANDKYGSTWWGSQMNLIRKISFPLSSTLGIHMVEKENQFPPVV